MLAAALGYSTPRETDRATVTSTLLTQIDDALTAAAIVIGGAFAYLKFIKGRVLTAAVGYEIRASVTTHAVQRRHMPRQPFTGPPVGALMVEVAIRNNGQPPAADLVLGPGDVLTLGVVFAVPSGHNAAAYLVVLNSFTVARRWLRPSGRWSETRKLIVPDQEAA